MTAPGFTFAIPEIETERLRLRAPRWDDFEAYAAFNASDRSVGVGGPYTRSRAFQRLGGVIGHWQLRGYGRWMVADKNTDEALGVVGPYFPEGWPEPEIAWTVFEAAEGRGIAYEAAKAARAFAYQALGWTTAISCVVPDNTRSAALAQRMGCVADGVHQHPDGYTLNIWRHPGPEAPA